MWLLLLSMVGVNAYFTGPLGIDWNDGLAYCQSQGSTLASITSNAEMAEAVAVCKAAGDPHGCSIGLTRNSFNGVPAGTLQWVDGSSTTFIQGWTNQDINHQGSEVCTLLWTEFHTGGTRVEDISCELAAGNPFYDNPPLCAG